MPQFESDSDDAIETKSDLLLLPSNVESSMKANGQLQITVPHEEAPEVPSGNVRSTRYRIQEMQQKGKDKKKVYISNYTLLGKDVDEISNVSSIKNSSTKLSTENASEETATIASSLKKMAIIKNSLGSLDRFKFPNRTRQPSSKSTNTSLAISEATLRAYEKEVNPLPPLRNGIPGIFKLHIRAF